MENVRKSQEPTNRQQNILIIKAGTKISASGTCRTFIHLSSVNLRPFQGHGGCCHYF